MQGNGSTPRADRQVPGFYRIDVVGPTTDGQITMSNRLRLGVGPLPEPPPRHDTLLVAGGEGARRATRSGDRRLDRACLAARAAHDAGLHRRLPAGRGGVAGQAPRDQHWEWCAGLAERHPAVEVDPDPVWVRDGDVWTSAGVTAGIDLALALVEDDLGAQVALAVARELAVFLKRPGGQSQFSGALSVQQATRPALRELQAWIAAHLSDDLSVAALAAHSSLSERSFARAFRAEIGQTPAAYVETLRVERARALLEDGAESLEAVTRATGFTSPEVLRRAFHRRVGVSPAAYRERFRLAV